MSIDVNSSPETKKDLAMHYERALEEQSEYGHKLASDSLNSTLTNPKYTSSIYQLRPDDSSTFMHSGPVSEKESYRSTLTDKPPLKTHKGRHGSISQDVSIREQQEDQDVVTVESMSPRAIDEKLNREINKRESNDTAKSFNASKGTRIASLYSVQDRRKSFKEKLLNDSVKRMKSLATNVTPVKNNAARSGSKAEDKNSKQIAEAGRNERKNSSEQKMQSVGRKIPEGVTAKGMKLGAKVQRRTLSTKATTDKAEEDEKKMQQLQDLFKSSFPEGVSILDSLTKSYGVRVSYPNVIESSKDSFSVSQIFKQSETESHMMNASRLNELEDPLEIQEKLGEIRRYSMEMNSSGFNMENTENILEGSTKNRKLKIEPSVRQTGEVSENEDKNVNYMSNNGEANARLEQFKNYFGITDKLSKLNTPLQASQERSESQPNQEMMGFASFSKEYAKTETLEMGQSYAFSSNNRPNNETIHKEPGENLEELQEQQINADPESDTYEKQLDEAIETVNIKMFLALRSILKPHKAIVLCCEGLVRLMAGFEGIPQNLSSKEGIEWTQLKVLFNEPVKFLNLVSTSKNLIQDKKIRGDKIRRLNEILAQIQLHLDIPYHEAYNNLHNYLVSVVKFYENIHSEESSLDREILPEPEQLQSVPNEYIQAPLNKAKVLAENLSRFVELHNRARSTGKSKYQLNKTQNEITPKKNKRQESREEVISKAKSLSRTPPKKSQGKYEKVNRRETVTTKKEREDSVKERYNEELSRNEELLMEVELSETEDLKDEIELNEKQARDYRNKVKKMLVDYERLVKKKIKEEEDFETMKNLEHAIEEWRRTHELRKKQLQEEREWRHARNMNYINEKKELTELRKKEEKENLNQELLEALQEHYYQSFIIQKNKETKQQELRERCKNVMEDKILKKQKDTMENISQKEELVKKRRDHYHSKKIDIENERKKWKADYLMLSKLIGGAK